MIQIKFLINSKDSTRAKKIQFCNTSEKNLDILYGIVNDSIQRKEKIDFDQLMIFCCYHITKEIRKNTIVEIIQKKLLGELSKHQSMVIILKEIKKMSIEATVDNIPKKILDFSFKQGEIIPTQTEPPALRYS